MKNEKLITYASMQLIVHEKKYPTHDLELVAIFFSLNIQSHYLYGVQVDVFSDNKSLQCVFNQKDLNLSKIRCLELLKDYYMSVLYHPGKHNVVKNTLSHLSMDNISHIEEEKKELVEMFIDWPDQLVNSTKSGVMVHNGSESYFLADCKAK